MGGLHDHRNGKAGVAHPGQHAHTIEAGHDQIEHDGVDRRRFEVHQPRQRGVAGLHHHGFVAATRHHVLDQTALHRIVIRDEDSFDHRILQRGIVPIWATMATKALMLS